MPTLSSSLSREAREQALLAAAREGSLEDVQALLALSPSASSASASSRAAATGCEPRALAIVLHCAAESDDAETTPGAPTQARTMLPALASPLYILPLWLPTQLATVRKSAAEHELAQFS